VSILEPRARHLMRAGVSLAVKHPESAPFLREGVPATSREDKGDHDPEDRDTHDNRPERRMS
jgi:hypothetical protein